MGRLLCILVFFLVAIFELEGRELSKQEKIQNLDRQIESLQELQLGYEAKALRLEDNADRLQFVDGELQNAKKKFALAEKNREVASRIQKQIQELKKKREDLLK